MITQTQQILSELKLIRQEVEFIKENMPDKDMFLTLDERTLLQESFKNEKEGKLLSSQQLRKQLGL